MQRLQKEGRAPNIIALENVAATLTSHGGKDFEALCLALVEGGYRIGARVIDAALFVPQSRPRMFLIGVHKSVPIPAHLLTPSASLVGVDKHVSAAIDRLNLAAKTNSELVRVIDNWLNWHLPEPQAELPTLESIIETDPIDVEWHTEVETRTLIDRMSDLNRSKVEKAREAGIRMYGTAYRRTRVQKGVKSVRTEVRFDGIAGCLRTPSGGSSRQIVVEIKGRKTRSRLMTPREAARLMGLEESYKLPDVYNEAYHLIGDGVAVPVVNYLRQNLFDPLLLQIRSEARQAA
jgi:DNA (cytosine-5)-methyltransferase 1